MKSLDHEGVDAWEDHMWYENIAICLYSYQVELSFHLEYECDGGYIRITTDANVTIHLAATVSIAKEDLQLNAHCSLLHT